MYNQLKVCLTWKTDKLSTNISNLNIKKSILRQSEEYIKFTLEQLFHQLERKHSEIRLGAFLVIDQLFM